MFHSDFVALPGNHTRNFVAQHKLGFNATSSLWVRIKLVARHKLCFIATSSLCLGIELVVLARARVRIPHQIRRKSNTDPTKLRRRSDANPTQIRRKSDADPTQIRRNCQEDFPPLTFIKHIKIISKTQDFILNINFKQH